MLERGYDIDFSAQFSNSLYKPIVLSTTLEEVKPWIIETLADTNLSLNDALIKTEIEIKEIAYQKIQQIPTLQSIQILLSAIFGKPTIITRLIRGRGERRLCIVSEGTFTLPTLENLSSGQASLFSIFSTIIRYSDFGAVPRTPAVMEGIVIVDEIDAHLHADLQYEVLPQLIRSFPKVQFVLTAHSPLFPLRMQRAFGPDGFKLIELPSGLTIDAERYSEFGSSLAYLRATQTFETEVRKKIGQGQRPLILSEGETDPAYLKAAAIALGFDDLVCSVDFDWVGQRAEGGGSQGAGKSNLDGARRFLGNNPQFLSRRIVLLYDCDTKKEPADEGNLFVRCLPFNAENALANSGIENLLQEAVFETRFYTEDRRLRGCTVVTTRELRKTELCQFLCGDAPNPNNFTKFEPILVELRRVLLGTGEGNGAAAEVAPASTDQTDEDQTE